MTAGQSYWTDRIPGDGCKQPQFFRPWVKRYVHRLRATIYKSDAELQNAAHPLLVTERDRSAVVVVPAILQSPPFPPTGA
jgi:hypothetical protein